MKNRAIKHMFAIQYNCDPDAIEVEYLATIPDNITEFKVSIQTENIDETLVFSCKSKDYKSDEYTL